MGECNRGPPRFNALKGVPTMGVEIVEVEPIFDHDPNSNGVAAFEEEAACCLVLAWTKGGNSPIGPTPPLEPACRPNMIFNN